MKKSVLFVILIALFVTGCQNTGTDAFDYERDAPEWLKDKIETMATNPTMAGSVVYRYSWSGDWVYHIEIPIHSCAFCELYTREGERIDNAEFDLAGFLENRTEEVVVWAWQ